MQKFTAAFITFMLFVDYATSLDAGFAFHDQLQEEYVRNAFLDMVNQDSDLLRVPREIQILDSIRLLVNNWGVLSKIGGTLPNGYDCLSDIYTILTAILRGELWALKNSFGKIGDGIMDGNIRWTGDYRSCYESHSLRLLPKDSPVKSAAQTTYCWLTFGPRNINISGLNQITRMNPKLMGLKSAICVPKSCSQETVLHFLKMLQEFLPQRIYNIFILNDVSCIRDLKIVDDPLGMFGLLTALLFGLLILVGTVYDVIFKIPTNLQKYGRFFASREETSHEDCNDGTDARVSLIKNDTITQALEKIPMLPPPVNSTSLLSDVLLAFSAKSNIKKIFKMKGDTLGSIDCLHGIRVLSLMWIILGHSHFFLFRNTDNTLYASEHLTKFFLLFLPQTVIAVDTFFFISALLVSYLYLKESAKKQWKAATWAYYYIHRYLRLTPTLALTMFTIRIALVPYLSSGPHSPGLDGIDLNRCKYSWWWNLLYINNFFSIDKTCYGSTWYVASDVQFYAIAPIILFFFTSHRFSFLAVVNGLALMIASWIVTGIIAEENKFAAGFAGAFREFNNRPLNYTMSYFQKIYCKPYCRISPYILGLGCGWILFRLQGKLSMKRRTVFVIWCLDLAVIACIVFGVHYIDSGTIAAYVYLSLSPSVWAICIGWIIIACHTNNGGIIGQFLSNSTWKPFSRLSYCTFLMHSIVINITYCSREKPLHMDYSTMLYLYIGNLVLAYLSSVLVCLAFESPTIAIEKAVWKYFAQNREKQDTVTVCDPSK